MALVIAGAAADVIAWLDIEPAEELLLAVSVDLSLEHAESPRIATALRPAAAIALQ
jgi:hypothetical protein